MINPFTVCGQLDEALKLKAKTVIVTAGASALVKQFVKLCKEEGVEVICIVRRDEQVKLMKEEYGVKNVLNQALESFDDDIKKVIAELNPTILFDYLGGDIPAKIFKLMPPNAQLTCVGFLTHAPIPIDSADLVSTTKVVKGLNLMNW